MNAAQKQMLRDALVAGLVTSGSVGLPLPTLKQVARAAGFRLDDAELDAHIHYLCGKGFAVEKSAVLSAASKRWEATAAAVEYCEAEGLI